MFELTIKTDNAAFDNTENFMADAYEVARILEETAASLREGITNDGLRDYNGNRVGEYKLT